MSDHMNARVFLLLMAARMVGDYYTPGVVKKAMKADSTAVVSLP